MSIINTDKAPAAIGPYSQAVSVNGILYTSGQIPIDPATGKLVEGDIRVQTEQVMKNLMAIVEAARADVNKTVKTLCFLKSMDDFGVFNEVYEKYFPGKPARSCVEVSALPKGALCEVEIIVAM